MTRDELKTKLAENGFWFDEFTHCWRKHLWWFGPNMDPEPEDYEDGDPYGPGFPLSEDEIVVANIDVLSPDLIWDLVEKRLSNPYGTS